MTDRYSGFYVVLTNDIRDDDAQATLTALRQIKGVASVEPRMQHSFESVTTRVRLVNELSQGFLELLENVRRGK